MVMYTCTSTPDRCSVFTAHGSNSQTTKAKAALVAARAMGDHAAPYVKYATTAPNTATRRPKITCRYQ